MNQTLDFRRFCVEMISTGDLDPVYIGVVNSELPPDQLRRWLLAYGMFYHVGVASYMSEHTGEEFWGVLHTAARNEVATPIGGRWPRASERRHFRGEFSVKCVDAMKARYLDSPEAFIDYIAAAAPDVGRVRERVEDHMGFGGWASFKFADLLDRVLGVPVQFDLVTAMYDTPVKGAQLVWDQHRSAPCADIKDAIELSEQIFKEATAGLLAPPLKDRPLSFNELETCLCKYKSHVAGRYNVGKDIHECLHASHDWEPVSQTAKRMNREFARLEENLK